jgi:hypothetical protein
MLRGAAWLEATAIPNKKINVEKKAGLDAAGEVTRNKDIAKHSVLNDRTSILVRGHDAFVTELNSTDAFSMASFTSGELCRNRAFEKAAPRMPVSAKS